MTIVIFYYICKTDHSHLMMKKREITKAKVLNTAFELFRNKGVQNVSVDEIVQVSGVAKGTFFYHFPQKDDVVYAIIDQEFSDYFEEPKQIESDNELNAVQKLEQFLAAMFSSFQSPNGVELMFKHGIPEHYHLFIDKLRNETLHPLIISIVEQGNKEGLFELKNIEIITAIINQGISSYIHSVYHQLSNYSELMKMLNAISELINNTLQSKQPINLIQYFKIQQP